jgi:hypothetical protein
MFSKSHHAPSIRDRSRSNKQVCLLFRTIAQNSRAELVLYAVHHSDPRQAQWLAGMSRSIPRKLPEPFVLPASEV